MARDMTEGRADEPGEEGRFVGVQQRPAGTWKDTSEGDLLTLVYVTEMRGKKGKRPGAMIFGSDPANAHFNRRANPLFVVCRLFKSEMTWLKEDLRKLGLENLPWVSEEDYDANIGPSRAFHYYAGGKRRYVIKEPLAHADKLVFRKIEDRLLQLVFLW